TLPAEVDTLVQRLMAKDPSQRPTMHQVAFELDRIWRHYWPPVSQSATVQVQLEQPHMSLPPPPPPAPELEEEEPRRWPIVAGVLGLALAVAGLARAVMQPGKKKGAAPDPEAKPVAAEVDAGAAAVAPPPPTPASAPAPAPAPAPKPLSPHDQAIADAKKALL